MTGTGYIRPTGEDLMKVILWLALAVALLLPGTRVTRAAGNPPLPACLTAVIGTACLGPAQMRQVYGVDSLLRHGITGRGKTIAIIVSFGSPTIRQDLHTFDREFSLPDPQLDIRAPLGTGKDTDPGWMGETTLDVEWAHAMAPGARILLLTSPVDETEGLQGVPQFFSLEQYAVQHGADVISQSWAATEDTLLDAKGRAMVAKFHRFYQDATSRGVTVLGASGDGGTQGLDLSLKKVFPYRTVQWPASDPLVLAVGGTQLARSISGWGGEIAWPGSGGGFSKLYGEPSYQRSLPAATQRALHGQRGLPDVALDAAKQSPFLLYRERWILAGGTSASTPVWAGLIALADSEAKHDLGSINAPLYRLAASSRYHRDFHDVTSGSILDPPSLESTGGPLHAAPGWDPATGLGSPHAASLLSDLVKAAGAAH
ncbi:MAG TPA: S53 family peptidase [Chloroflexota bacterium]